MHFPTDRTAHTTAFDEPVVDHWFIDGFQHQAVLRYRWQELMLCMAAHSAVASVERVFPLPNYPVPAVARTNVSLT